MDLFTRIRQHMGPLGQYASIAEGYYVFPQLQGPLGAHMQFNNQSVICWSINNYLGLAEHPEVRKADEQALRETGMAYPMGARLMTGETTWHLELEQRLSTFVRQPDTCLLNFGYQGMVSCIDALVSRHDVIVYDAECHACIVDGVRLHMGKRIAFEHNNIGSLEKHLIRATELSRESNGGILVISEGVFGMRGDQGKLNEIAQLKQKYPFRFLVDDAHGFGVLGPRGEGVGVAQVVNDQIDIYFGTFAKSMATIGAFVAGPTDIVKYLRYNMRSQIFAKSLPLPIVKGALKRLEIIETEPQHKEKLWSNVSQLQQGLRSAGFDIGTTNSPVTPVFLKGEPKAASQMVYDLRENYGIFCSMVLYPMIPKGESILRLIPTAAHSQEDIERTLDAFSEVAQKLAQGKYNTTVYNPVLKMVS